MRKLMNHEKTIVESCAILKNTLKKFIETFLCFLWNRLGRALVVHLVRFTVSIQVYFFVCFCVLLSSERYKYKLLNIIAYDSIVGIPYLQSRVKGPKWIPFLVGVHLKDLSFILKLFYLHWFLNHFFFFSCSIKCLWLIFFICSFSFFLSFFLYDSFPRYWFPLVQVLLLEVWLCSLSSKHTYKHFYSHLPLVAMDIKTHTKS